MTKADEIRVNQLIHKIGLKYHLRDSEVKEIIESQFRFAYDTIRELNLDEDIETLKTNFIFKYLGKLYIDKNTLNKRRNGRTEEF